MSEPAASAITAPHQPPAQDSLSATLNYKSQTVVKSPHRMRSRGELHPAVAIGVILAALAVVGYFLWKADQPRFPRQDSGRAEAMRKAWDTNPAFRNAILRMNPHAHP